MPRFSIVTTCKGRLHHLKQSLPRFLAQRDSEVVVVDYDCPDGTADYVRREHPKAQVVAVVDRALFSASEARNLGAAAATGDWLVFLDADVLIAPDMAERLAAIVAPQGRYYCFGSLEPDRIQLNLFGSCVVRRADFLATQGYDVVFQGYGGEDTEFYARLDRMKLVLTELGPGLVETVLEHGLEERTRFYKRKTTLGPVRINAAYRLVKHGLLGHYGVPELPEEMRRNIYVLVRRSVKDAFRRGQTVVRIAVPLPDDRAPMSQWEWQAKRQLLFHLELKQPGAEAKAED